MNSRTPKSSVPSFLLNESGGALLMLVFIGGLLTLFTAGGASLYVSKLEKKVSQEKVNRLSDSAAQSALELTNTLITGHILIKDSVTGQWRFQRDGFPPTDPVRLPFLVFQPKGVAWKDHEVRWVANALKRKKEGHANLWRTNLFRMDAGFVQSEGLSDVVENDFLDAPIVPTLIFNFEGTTPIVELVKPNALGEEILVFVDASPLPKTIRARVGGLCQDYDPEPLAMIYRNYTGKEPTPSEDASFYNKQNFPFAAGKVRGIDTGADILRVQTALGGNSSAAQARISRSADQVVKELYKMYFARPPDDSANETAFLANLLKGGKTFAEVASAMKTSRVFRFINEANGSHYYTTKEDNGYAKGFAYGGVEFYIYGAFSGFSFAPNMVPLYSCHHPSKKVYFISKYADCRNAVLGAGSSQETVLGYVYPIEQKQQTALFEYSRVKGGKTDILTTISPTAPAGYLPLKGTAFAYVSLNDDHLASAIALYRTITNQLYPLENVEAFAFNSIFARESENSEFNSDEALKWLGETFKSYKSYHDTESCGAAIPPAPRCYLTGPSQVPANSPAQVVLHAYGEFDSVKWDGIEVSNPVERSEAGMKGYVDPANMDELVEERSITAPSDGRILTSATVSLAIKGGKTLSTTCSLAQKSVVITVIPNNPRLSLAHVSNKKTDPTYPKAFSFRYVTQGFKSPSPRCQIVSTDNADASPENPYTSNLLNAPSGDVLMGSGIDADTDFKITCWDKDHTEAISQVKAIVFPVPTCCMSGCATITTGYSAPFQLDSVDYPDRAIWDQALFTSRGLPETTLTVANQNKSAASTHADVNGPGGASSCGTAIKILPTPPPIPVTTCTSATPPLGSTTTAGTTPPQICTTTWVPAPIPPASGCGNWCSNNDPCSGPNPPCTCANASPKKCDPCSGPNPPCTCANASRKKCDPPKDCRIKMVVSNDHDCPRGNKGEGIVRWALYIPAKSSTPVKSIEYGKTGQTNTPCVVPKPSPPPDVWIENGITYQLNGGNGRGGWHKDCILKVDPQSPLMIDLNDEKIRLTSPDAGTRFDLEGNGAAEMYSWPSNPDNSVFLAYDKNGDGIINDVHELFGNNTVGPDGKKTSNGFEALKKYDLNQDGTIDSLDGIFPKLRVWFAYSKDGKPTTPSVLKTLGDVGIKSIDLDYLERIEKNGPYGDMSRQRSTIGTKDGRPRNVFDMWLVSY